MKQSNLKKQKAEFFDLKNKWIKYPILAFLGFTFLLTVVSLATAEKLTIKTVSIKLITPITDTTKSAKGTLTNLTAKAQQLGLDDYIVIGKLSRSSPKDGKITYNIKWHSLAKETTDGKKATAISPPLISKFRTKASLKVIKPTTVVSAKGDLNAVVVALTKVKSKTEEPKEVSVANSGDLKTKSTAKQSYGANTGSASSGTSSSGLGSGSGDLSQEPSTDKQEVKACVDRVGIESGFAFVQERMATVDKDGTEKTAGTCRDTGKKYALNKRYGGACTPFVAGDKVFQSYRTLYTNDKQEVIAQDCTRDRKNKVLDVITTKNGCTARLDFAKNKAIVNKRKYYALDGVVNTVQACTDTSTQYAISEKNCDFQVDPVKNIAIKRTKLVWTNGQNQLQTARACTAKTGAGSTVPIIEEFADKTHTVNYINDFATKTSWLKSRKYYLQNGAKVYVSNWDKGTKTYQHQEVVGSCFIEKDNTNLKARQNFETKINVDSNVYKVRDCQGGKWVNHKYLATVWTPESIVKNALIYGKHTIISSGTTTKDLNFSAVKAFSSNAPCGGSNGWFTARATKRKTFTKTIYVQELRINNTTQTFAYDGFSTNPTSFSTLGRAPQGCSFTTYTSSADLKGITSPNYTQTSPSASWIGGGSVNLNDKVNYTTASKLLGRTNVITYKKKQKYKVLGNTFFYNYPKDSSGNDSIQSIKRLDSNNSPADIAL